MHHLVRCRQRCVLRVCDCLGYNNCFDASGSCVAYAVQAEVCLSVHVCACNWLNICTAGFMTLVLLAALCFKYPVLFVVMPLFLYYRCVVLLCLHNKRLYQNPFICSLVLDRVISQINATNATEPSRRAVLTAIFYNLSCSSIYLYGYSFACAFVLLCSSSKRGS